MTSMQELIDRENIKALVARDIICQQTGRVLDWRTCLVVRDKDGDPRMVLDPSCASHLRNRVESVGWSLDLGPRS